MSRTILKNSLKTPISLVVGWNGCGKKYYPSIVKLFEVVHNFNGTSTHNFFFFNLFGLVMNTSQKIYKVKDSCTQLV